jgi:hypothetical protein
VETLPSQPMSMPQFTLRLSEYVAALRTRNRRLAMWFLGLLVAIFAALGIPAVTGLYLPKPVLLVVLLAGLVSLIALALYVVFSSSRFHHAHGIRCTRCGAVQIFAGAELHFFRGALKNGLRVVDCQACAATIAHG